MNSRKVNKFRSLMAERGVEMTPEEALDAYKALRQFMKVAKDLSMKDIWQVAEHNEEYAKLYMKAKEI